jgi:hypothetical protein
MDDIAPSNHTEAHPCAGRTNIKIPEVVDVETRQLKSDAQIKREWEERLKNYREERDQDIRLACLQLIYKDGPETYKKGKNLYEIAEKMFDYVSDGKY